MFRRLAHALRLAKVLPGEEGADETETGRAETRPTVPPPLHEDRAERGTDHRAGARRCREPAKAFRAVFRLARVRDVRLQHPNRAAAEALHHAREEENPD